LVCRSPRINRRTVTFAQDAAKVCEMHVCSNCGFVRNLTNSKSKYEGKASLDEIPGGSGIRTGTHQRPGREFHMAKMAVDILGHDDVEVLVYGAGRSFDNYHIERLKQVRGVAIGDIINLRDDAEFVDANNPASRRFPIVIASEVVEHFREPREDFLKLFRLVERHGLLVCGTNIYNGGNLSRDPYIFFQDHTAYYTPSSLYRIARDAGYHIDFRAPGLSRMRKKYVLLTKSRQVLDRAACYFGDRMFAPSEVEFHPPRKKVNS